MRCVYSTTSCRTSHHHIHRKTTSFPLKLRSERGHYEKYFPVFAVPCEGMFFLIFIAELLK